jgi:hypothetical protein
MRTDVTMPEGLAARDLAVSKMLDGKIGYVRILGSMNEPTRKAFFDAFDELKGAKGILLDCRGMGGGGDSAAWAMAGRFYSKATNLGTSGTLMPSGEWQFDGPVVMLQDDREISSAETFTWAMTETDRAVSVGRPTAGGTIIPTSFKVPSGMFELKLGVTDRKTPILGNQPEGQGTPPDIHVPYEPVLLKEMGDPDMEVGRFVLVRLMDGEKRGSVIRDFPEAFFTKRARAGFVSWAKLLCRTKENPMPDFESTSFTLEANGESTPAGWAKEIAAQKAYEAMIAKEFPPGEAARKAFLEEHGGTRYGTAVKKGFN